jgi:hypothetical protein
MSTRYAALVLPLALAACAAPMAEQQEPATAEVTEIDLDAMTDEEIVEWARSTDLIFVLQVHKQGERLQVVCPPSRCENRMPSGSAIGQLMRHSWQKFRGSDCIVWTDSSGLVRSRCWN